MRLCVLIYLFSISVSDVLESNWETVKEGVLEDSRNLTGVLPILNISLDTPVKDKQFVKVTVKSFYGFSSGLEYFGIVRTDTRQRYSRIYSIMFTLTFPSVPTICVRICCLQTCERSSARLCPEVRPVCAPAPVLPQLRLHLPHRQLGGRDPAQRSAARLLLLLGLHSLRSSLTASLSEVDLCPGDR